MKQKILLTLWKNAWNGWKFLNEPINICILDPRTETPQARYGFEPFQAMKFLSGTENFSL